MLLDRFLVELEFGGPGMCVCNTVCTESKMKPLNQDWWKSMQNKIVVVWAAATRAVYCTG